jgi:ferredoxin
VVTARPAPGGAESTDEAAAGTPALSVDQARCCGAGQCVLTAPEVFDQDEDTGLVVLLDPRPPASASRAVRDAAAFCPAGAIRLAVD